MEPEYQGWKVENLLKDASNSDATGKKGAAMGALNKNYPDARNDSMNNNNLPEYLQDGGGLIIAMGVILAIIGIV